MTQVLYKTFPVLHKTFPVLYRTRKPFYKTGKVLYKGGNRPKSYISLGSTGTPVNNIGIHYYASGVRAQTVCSRPGRATARRSGAYVSERAVRRVCASQLPRMPPKYDGEAMGSDLEPLFSIGSLCSALSRHPRLGLPPACGAAERRILGGQRAQTRMPPTS